MRNKKFLRTCKGCFQKFDKANLENDVIQIGYNKEKKEYIIKLIDSNNNEKENKDQKENKKLFMNIGKTLYICKNEKCINLALKKKTISRFFNKELSENEIKLLEELKK